MRQLLVLFGVALFSLSSAFADHIEPPSDRIPAQWLGPQPMNLQKAKIGQQMSDVRLTRLFGGYTTLHESAGPAGTVVVVRDPECPVSRAYGPRVAELSQRFAAVGFNFVILYLNESLDDLTLARDAGGFDGPAVFVTDGGFKLAEQLGVHSTGDVFVLDPQQRIRYRGAVDDQYGLGYTKELPDRHLLLDALLALLRGQEVADPAMSAPGCYIDADPATDNGFEPLSGQQLLG